MLKLKNKNEPRKKKVLIYGEDGSGKSTFAAKYCKENNLKPIVIDFEDTNFTDLPTLDLIFKNDIQTFSTIKNVIKELGETNEYDTIIMDGISSLLEMLTSKAKGMAAYSERSKRWNEILFALENTRKNLIFIGQIDFAVIYTSEQQSSKAVIKVNAMVNEKYYCYKSGNEYRQDVKKFRTVEQI